MRKRILAVMSGLALISSGCLMGGAIADEAPVVRSKNVRARCQGPYCGPYAPCVGGRCRVACPPYSPCFPLYGAYGPIGGTGYWGAYTYSGWGSGW
jgi:hypothetical protein